MNEIIKVEKLTYCYGTKLAWNGLIFEVGRGKVFSLPRPNSSCITSVVKQIQILGCTVSYNKDFLK
jgi:hypothetical protein